MNLNKYFQDKNYLNDQISFFKEKQQLQTIEENPELVGAYLAKAKHNMEFFTINKNNAKFGDWLVVTLYYALYHSALALLAHKQYVSKNHTATLLFLIKEYSINQEEAQLISELSISKDDAELYTDLKTDRHHASYNTKALFTEKKIEQYRSAVVDFIQKAQDIIKTY